MNCVSSFFFRRKVRAISISGRLAIALHCFASACQNRNLLDHPEIQLFLSHMWRLIGTDSESFAKWEATNTRLVHVGLGDAFPPDFLAFLDAKRITETDFRALLANLVEVVYHNAYGAPDNKGTLRFLENAVDCAKQLGGQCPDPTRFAKSRWTDCHGWGERLSAEELAEWRFPSEES